MIIWEEVDVGEVEEYQLKNQEIPGLLKSCRNLERETRDETQQAKRESDRMGTSAA